MQQETQNQTDFYMDADEQMMISGEGMSFKGIVLQQVARVSKLESQEWFGGFFSSVSTNYGNAERWIPDSRREFINSVKALYDLLNKHFDKEMKKDDEDFKKELEELHTETKNKRNEQSVSSQMMKGQKNIEMFNNYVFTYWQETNTRLAELYRTLFQALIRLLNRLNYLDVQRQSEGKK